MSEVKKLIDVLVKKHGKTAIPPDSGAAAFGAAKKFPEDYIEFLTITDGLDDIYGIEGLVEINERHKKDIELYFDQLYEGKYKAEDFVCFADDGMGGYYAFSKNTADKKVYYFDHDNYKKVVTFDSFIDWLKDRIEIEDFIEHSDEESEAETKPAVKRQFSKPELLRGIGLLVGGAVCLILVLVFLLNGELEVKKQMLQVLAMGGVALLIAGAVFIFIAFRKGRAASKPAKAVPQKPQQTENTVQYRYNSYVSSKPRYDGAETTKRTPIEYNDKDYDKKIAELREYTKAFLDKVVYPAGFAAFIENFGAERYIVKNRGSYGDFFEVYDVLKLEEIKEYSLDLFTARDDYHTQFRDLVAFGVDESGHGEFFLDYGQSKAVPSVKFLDNEIDIVEHVADNFDEFLANLADEENPAVQKAFKKIDEIISGGK